MKAPVQLESGGRAFDHTDSYWENWEEKQGLSYSQEDLDAVDNNNKQKEVEVIIQRENTEVILVTYMHIILCDIKSLSN